MSLPIYLIPGDVYIYGLGTDASRSGVLQAVNQEWKFGTIYGSWAGTIGTINAQVGTSVMFNTNDVRLAIKWNGYPYSIINENKIGATEIISTPEPEP